MKRRFAITGAVMTLLAAVLGFAISSPGVGGATTADCAPAGPDWAAPGPFEVTVQAGGPEHTLYRPAELGPCGAHPVIVWGNGTWAQPWMYGGLLRHLASHGFIVVAANTGWAGSGQEMLAGLDYLDERNSTAGDEYAGHVDLSRVGATGHSQGGGGAIAAGADPRVDTTAPIEPGPQGDEHTLRGPAFFLAGEDDGIVNPNTLVYPRYQKITHVSAVYGELAGAGHFTPVGNGGGFRGPVTAWFRSQLLGDDKARAEFTDPTCGYCNAPIWSRFERNTA